MGKTVRKFLLSTQPPFISACMYEDASTAAQYTQSKTSDAVVELTYWLPWQRNECYIFVIILVKRSFTVPLNIFIEIPNVRFSSSPHCL